jgi:RNA methyltransferase, TrmH family
VTFLGTITSPDNAHVKHVRSLHKKRARYRDKRYLLEGLRLVGHALDAGYRPALAFYTEEFASGPGQDLVRALHEADIPAWITTPAVMERLADTVTPQGIVAVLPIPDPPPLPPDASLLLVLDEIRDPGNLGTILRTAQAARVDAVLLTPGCVDPYAPKVVRAGMGAQISLALHPDTPWEAVLRLTAGTRRVLAEPTAPLTLWEWDWTEPTTLIVGGEAHGAGPEARAAAEARLRLPMAEEVESLNAAIATAVFLFEARRQRHNARSTSAPRYRSNDSSRTASSP